MLDSFLIALNAVLPLMLYLAFGFFLVRAHIVKEDFMQALNRFNFKALFPFMMFNNVYAAAPAEGHKTAHLVLAIAVMAVIAAACVYVTWFSGWVFAG